MKFIPNVQGSKELAVPLIIQKTTVYLKTNIHKIEKDDIELYEWDEYQYDKDEYIQSMQENILNLTQKDLENKVALTQIYEMVVESVG